MTQPSLFEFLILSMLLHLLVIVLFGNPSGGAGRRSEEPSSLDVILGRPSPERGAGFRLAPGAETKVPGSALLPRTGAQPQPPSTLPGETEESAGAPSEPRPGRSEPPAASAEAPAPARETAPAAPSAPRALPPGIDVRAPQEVDRAYAPKAPLEALAPPKFEGRLAPPVELAPSEVPVRPTAPLERIAPLNVEGKLAPPVELAPPEAPVAPAAPMPSLVAPRFAPELTEPAQLIPRELPTPAAPIERIAPRAIERPLAPSVELSPRELPVAPAAPIEHIAPQSSERQLSAPAELKPPEIPLTPAAPMERIAPPPTAPLEHAAPPVELHTPLGAPTEATPSEGARPKEGEAASPVTPLPRETTPQVERGAPSGGAPEKPGAAPERFHFGSPTPEEELFKPRANVMPPLDEGPSPPYIDLEGARKAAAREIVREGAGSRAILALPVAPPPEYKSKEARALEKAVKPDCRTEYAALGLFAVPALLVSALADTGCRW